MTYFLKNISFILIIFFSYSCKLNNNTKTYRLGKSQKTTPNSSQLKQNTSINQLSWEQPNSWIQTKTSGMRLVSFQVPYSDGTGDLSVISLNGDGGGVESNINRWRRQLDLEPQTLEKIESKLLFGKGCYTGSIILVDLNM